MYRGGTVTISHRWMQKLELPGRRTRRRRAKRSFVDAVKEDMRLVGVGGLDGGRRLAVATYEGNN